MHVAFAVVRVRDLRGRVLRKFVLAGSRFAVEGLAVGVRIGVRGFAVVRVRRGLAVGDATHYAYVGAIRVVSKEAAGLCCG